MRPGDLFHVGIVVEEADHDATLERLTAVAGYRWLDEIDVTLPVRLADGERELRLRFSYSRDEPRLEVIRAVPGTPWVPAEGSGVHHLGYWSDDVLADVERLVAEGCTHEASAGAEDAPAFVYLRDPAGPRIELIPATTRPLLEQLWA